MVIIDKTPYRSPTGEISPIGLIQGTLKYGLSWQNRLKAQDVVIAIIEKQLDSNFALLRNVTLPNTDIHLPLVLIGPSGISLLNVAHGRGVYQARDDQWGTMIGDRFVPARINQISLTATYGRVLQRYLEREGFKGAVVVEPILMASDPGMQIESTRPAVRVIMSDALERFAASISHARPMIDAPLGKDLVRSILVGRPKQIETEIEQPQPETTSSASFGDFAFDDRESDQEPIETKNQQQPSVVAKPQPNEKPKKVVRKKKGPLGLTTAQLMMVGGAGFLLLCVVIAAIIFIVLTLPNG